MQSIKANQQYNVKHIGKKLWLMRRVTNAFVRVTPILPTDFVSNKDEGVSPQVGFIEDFLLKGHEQTVTKAQVAETTTKLNEALTVFHQRMGEYALLLLHSRTNWLPIDAGRLEAFASDDAGVFPVLATTCSDYTARPEAVVAESGRLARHDHVRSLGVVAVEDLADFSTPRFTSRGFSSNYDMDTVNSLAEFDYS